MHASIIIITPSSPFLKIFGINRSLFTASVLRDKCTLFVFCFLSDTSALIDLHFTAAAETSVIWTLSLADSHQVSGQRLLSFIFVTRETNLDKDTPIVVTVLVTFTVFQRLLT